MWNTHQELRPYPARYRSRFCNKRVMHLDRYLDEFEFPTAPPTLNCLTEAIYTNPTFSELDPVR